MWEEVSQFAASLHPDVAHFPVAPGKWTISREFDHIILSAEPIVKMLHAGPEQIGQLPKVEKEHQSYQTIKDTYYHVLGSQTVNAPARFRTDDAEKSDWDFQQQNWAKIGLGIQAGLDKWTEQDLDSAQVQHPVLKHLWVREMLFFTHIHTLHHVTSMKGKARIVSAL